MDILCRYKDIIRDLGLSGKDMSGLLGLNYSSYRSMTRKGGRYVPKWVRSFVVCYELMK